MDTTSYNPATSQWGDEDRWLNYDLSGNVLSDQSNTAGQEFYGWDALGRLVGVHHADGSTEGRHYDGAGRLVRFDTSGGRSTTNLYDEAGRLSYSDQQGGPQGQNYQGTSYVYDNVGNVLTAATRDKPLGQLGSTSVSQTSYSYAQGEGYLQTQVKSELYRESRSGSGNSVTRTPQGTGAVQNRYDANGHLTGQTNTNEANEAWRTHTYVNDAGGQVLWTQDGGGHAQRQLIVNGQVLGRYGEVATPGAVVPGNWGMGWTNLSYASSAQFDFASQGVSSMGTTPTAWVVSEDDTLSSIAQSVYGDAGLWYRIAQANNLADASSLMVGQVLTIPPALSSTNNVNTFTPYDPSRIVAKVDPTLKMMPQPKDSGGCGGLGKIIVAIVAVVVTIYTAGALSGATGGFMSTMSAGASALGGTAAAAGSVGASLGVVGTAAVSGAVGSVISQGVGIAIGAQDSFSWKGVALSAIGAGVTAGVGSLAQQAGGALSALGGDSFGAALGRAAVGNVATQGIAVATGLQSSFSWKSVATSVLTSAVGQGFNAVMDYQPGVKFDLGKSVGSAIGSGAIVQLAVNGKINATQLATDAFNNVLSDSLVRSSTSGGAGQKSSGGGNSLDAFLALNDNFSGVDVSSPTGGAQLLNDPGWRPTSGYDYAGSGGGGITGWQPTNSVNVASGNTLEGLARQRYGDDWRAGMAVMAQANGLKTNQWGSPMIYAGDTLTTPGLGVLPEGSYGAYDAAGGRIIANNAAGLNEKARQEAWVQEMTARTVTAMNSANTITGMSSAQVFSAYTAPVLSNANLATIQKYANMDLSNPGGAQMPLSTGSVLADRVLGGAEGALTAGWKMLDGGARIVGNTVLQIGDILTGGVNHDSPVLQQAWIEQGALAQGVVNLATSPRAVIGKAIDNVAETYARAETLRAQGDGIGAAQVTGEMTSAIAAGVLGGAQAVRGAASLGAAGLRNLGVSDWNIVMGDVPNAQLGYQAGGVGVRLESINGAPLFRNQLPESLATELSTASKLGVTPISPASPAFDAVINEGTIKYAMTPNGDLLVVPKYAANGTEISHAVIMEGRPVIAAGEANIAGNAKSGYIGIDIDAHSGHYMNGNTAAQNAAVEGIAKEAFGKFGILWF